MIANTWSCIRSLAPRCVLVALLQSALVLATPSIALAHDPGLSSLEIAITSDEIVATLSLARSDAASAGFYVEPQAERRNSIDALEIRLDGRQLDGVLDQVTDDGANAARVRMRYVRTNGSTLTVRSTILRRLPRGHRELLSIRDERGVVLAQRMLDAESMEWRLDIGRSDGALRQELRASRAPSRDGGGTAGRFFTLGVQHILGGYDHLLFLAGLLLVARGLRDVAKTITAFTAAHSLTLGLAAMGWVTAPPALVEPLIAASIVYVGVENVLRRQAASRWKLTFVFGLVHGFGFAGALRELGIGSGGMTTAVPLASFNMGVEAGQLAVAMTLLPMIWRVRERPGVYAVVSASVLGAGCWVLGARVWGG